MNREECKNKLLSLGVDPELLKKPAIFESCMEEFLDEDSRGTFAVLSNDDGSFTVGKQYEDNWSRSTTISSGGQSLKRNYVRSSKQFSDVTSVEEELTLTDNGLLKDINHSWDSYGPLDGGLYGQVKASSHNNMLGTYLDFGFISYDDFNSKRIQLSKDSYDYPKERLSLADVMAAYDDHHKAVTQLYPDLDEYYKSRRTQVAKSAIAFAVAHGEKSTLDVSQEDIDAYGFTDMELELLEQLKESYSANEEDKKQIRKLQGMLGKAIKFAEKVRQHPIGKIFFRKDIPDLDDRDQNR